MLIIDDRLDIHNDTHGGSLSTSEELMLEMLTSISQKIDRQSEKITVLERRIKNHEALEDRRIKSVIESLRTELASVEQYIRTNISILRSGELLELEQRVIAIENAIQ